MHGPFVRKIVSNPSTCLFVQRFLYERKCGFIDNIFRPLCSHFVGLSSPTHSLFIQKKSFFAQETNYLTLYEPGWFNLSTTLHGAPSWIGYCDVIDLSFRHLYFHEPIMVLIFLYIGQEPMVSAVA